MRQRRNIDDFAQITRRRWLQAGGALAGAVLWPSLLRAQEARRANAPAKQAIVIFLQGGLSHYESFDPKPDAPSEYRGEFGHIPTTVPGVHFAEHLPLLARRAHKFNLIRSAYVDSPSHPVAIHMTLTGWDQPDALEGGRNGNYPSVGSFVARACGGRVRQLPAYVAVPHSGQLGRRVHFASAGPLGSAYEPMDSGMPPETAAAHFAGPQDLRLTDAISSRRLADRVTLLRALHGRVGPDEVEGLDPYHRHALEMISTGQAARAFDINREPLAQRERYGNHLWGQQTILARRLAEAGVPFTLVNYTLTQDHGQDWDTHVDNFNAMKNILLPPMDLAVSTLLDDLEERGLLESTIVAMYGEFGRTPRINANAGRDHWEKVFTVMLAGGGLKSGVVVGASTRAGDVPKDRPVHFNDILATIYHQLGVPIESGFQDRSGRPLPVLSKGTPIEELL